MKDCNGNELNIGDKVVYIHGKNTDARLNIGIITKFYTNRFGSEECSVGSATYILRKRVMKLE